MWWARTLLLLTATSAIEAFQSPILVRSDSFVPAALTFPMTLGEHRDVFSVGRRKRRSSALSVASAASLSTSGTTLVRSVFIRALAAVYAVSFAISLSQNAALIGDDGITPAKRVLDQAQARGLFKRHQRLQWRKEGGDRISNQPALSGWRHFLPMPRRPRPLHAISRWLDLHSPTWVRMREIWWDRSDRADRPVTTLLWLANNTRTDLNSWLDSLAVNGLALSVAMMVTGAANVPIMAAVWLFHRSIMAVGGPWFAYGWEPQLAELGFHALFLVPLFSLDPMHPMPIPAAVRWCIQWHLFRVMIGAGLIKLRSGDRKWKDLTAMNHFYETQPVPNPLTRYFHWMPPWWHKTEVLINHFVELIAPWLLIIPGLPVPLRRAGGIIQLLFQSVLILSGNLSFLNWITMVPAIMCLDDALLGRFFSSTTQLAARSAAASSWMHVSVTREVISISFLILVLALSRPVVKNLLSPNQAMNRSYDPLRLINTYGAFGTVNEEREEFIISSAHSWDGEFREYEFNVKPGNIHRSPQFLSPYHYRLDWQMWIAATCGRIENSPWMYRFLIKLLEQDNAVLNGLMAGDPWQDSDEPPKYIRVQRYRYKFHKPSRGEENPPYWDRELIGNVYPRMGVATIESLREESPI